MQQQWRVRIKGVQREQVNIDLLIQAALELAKQLAAESPAPAGDDAGTKESA